MTLRAILFDLWGTLILDPPERSRPRQLWRAEHVYETLINHDFDVDLTAVDAALVAAMRALGALQDQGLDLTTGGRASLFCDELEQTLGLLLQTRASGLRTALVSNAGFTTSPYLRRMLDYYGLTPHLDVLVFSDEQGVAKPDTRLFTHALDGLGVSARQCAFVGDSPHNDVGGAQKCGLFAVQIGRRDMDGVRPEARIDTLSELLPVLEQHGLVAGVSRPERP
jgi:putative hydrolase of the HAD superfamily